jgi:hypothetical protein
MTFPTTLDTFPNPGVGTYEDDAGFEHDLVTANMGDAIEALMAKVGINGSAVTTAIDYILNHLNPSVRFSLGSKISPAQITANQNNYAPAGLDTCSVVRLTTDASRNMTGLTAPTGSDNSRVLFVLNVGSFDLVLQTENASSTAANRFSFNTDLVLSAGMGAVLWYDTTSSRWRAPGSASAGGGGGAPTTASYVTTAAEGGLSNEQVLGTAVLMAGTASGRPAAATAGRYYFETDTLLLKRDNGATWDLQGFGFSGTPNDADTIRYVVGTGLWTTASLAPLGGNDLWVPTQIATNTFAATTTPTEPNAADHRHRAIVDVTDFAKASFSVACTTAVANSRYALVYSIDNGVTYKFLEGTTMTGTPPTAPANTFVSLAATGMLESSASPITLPTEIKTAGVFIEARCWMTAGTGSPITQNAMLRLWR